MFFVLILCVVNAGLKLMILRFPSSAGVAQLVFRYTRLAQKQRHNGLSSMWFLKVLSSFYRSVKVSWTQWHTLIIITLRRRRQEDVELKASLGYLSRPCLKKGGVEYWSVPSFFGFKVSSPDAL